MYATSDGIVLAPLVNKLAICVDTRGLEAASTSGLRLICHTRDNRWTTALLGLSALASDGATLRVLVGGREGTMHAACLIGAVPEPLLERLSLGFEDVQDTE